MSNINWRIILNHTILLIGVIFMSLPVWVAFSTSTHSAETILREGLQFWPGTNFEQKSKYLGNKYLGMAPRYLLQGTYF